MGSVAGVGLIIGVSVLLYFKVCKRKRMLNFAKDDDENDKNKKKKKKENLKDLVEEEEEEKRIISR